MSFGLSDYERGKQDGFEETMKNLAKLDKELFREKFDEEFEDELGYNSPPEDYLEFKNYSLDELLGKYLGVLNCQINNSHCENKFIEVKIKAKLGKIVIEKMDDEGILKCSKCKLRITTFKRFSD